MGLIDCQAPEVVENTCSSCWAGRGAQEPRKPRIFKFKELEIATNFFSEKNVLGKGSHSCVYKATLSTGEVVAVKRPTLGRRALEDALSFDSELDILSRLRHRHMVNLIGFCNEAHEKLLVVEFMVNGTLFDLLHSNREPLSWSARMHMASQAAQAILALHSASPPIIHRDVKSSNILIDGHWNAKLSDMGLALRGQLDDVNSKLTPPAGTMGYIDPEYQTPAQLSSKSDVFSFGIVLLELMSGRKAIDVRYNPSSLLDWAVPLIRQGNVLDVCDKSIKAPQNVKVVHYLASIAARSVRQAKDRRPTMVEVVDGLQRIKRKLPATRFGGRRPSGNNSPLGVAVPKREVRREGPSRINTAQALALKDDVRDDSGEAVSFSKSEVFSGFDEGRFSGEGIFSPSDTERSSSSQAYMMKGWKSGDGDRQATPSQGSPAASRPLIKHESPIFNMKSSRTMVSSSFTVDMSPYLTGSPLSPLSTPPRNSVNYSPVDRNTPTRSVESSVFGSKNFVRKRASSSKTSQIFSIQGADSRLKSNESRSLGLHLASGRKSLSETKKNSSKGYVPIESFSSVLEQSKGQPLSKRDEDTAGIETLSSYEKVRPNNDTTTRISSVEVRASRDAKVGSNGGLILQSSVTTRSSNLIDVQENGTTYGVSGVEVLANIDAKVDSNGGLILQSTVMTLSSNLKDLRENGTTDEISRVGGSANRNATVDSRSSILQPRVSFRMDVIPNWGLGMPAAAAKFYNNVEPHFESVDLPILV